jgi:hypothetical protein
MPLPQFKKIVFGRANYVHPEFTGRGDPNPFFRLDPSIDPVYVGPDPYGQRGTREEQAA